MADTFSTSSKRNERCPTPSNVDSSIIRADTRVFWDINDFPVPSGCNVNEFREKIRKSLYREFFCGDVSVWVYGGGMMRHSMNHLRALGFVVGKHSVYKPVRLNHMISHMMDWAYRNPVKNRSVNLMVIAKDFSEEGVKTQFIPTLAGLERRGYNVFFVVPDDTATLEQTPFPKAVIVWHWTKLFNGQEGSFPVDSDSDYDSDSSSKRYKKSGGEESSGLLGGNLNVSLLNKYDTSSVC